MEDVRFGVLLTVPVSCPELGVNAGFAHIVVLLQVNLPYLLLSICGLAEPATVDGEKTRRQKRSTSEYYSSVGP